MSILRNKTVLLALKLLVSGSLLTYVLTKAGVGSVLSLLGRIRPGSFVLAVFMFLCMIFLGSVRWRYLLPGRFSLRKLLPLYLLGSFFNTFMPGLVGGDVVKIYYLYKETGQGKQALASVFMDRYMGFFALMLLGMAAWPFGLRYFAGTWIEWLLPLIVLLFLAGSLLVLWLRLGKRFGVLNEIYEYFHTYRKQRGVMAKALGLSALIQTLSIFMVFVLARGLGQHIAPLVLFIFVPIISTLASLPLSISGIGIREAATVFLLGTQGVDAETATAISFAWFLAMAAAGLAGLYEYLKTRGAKG
ncbi:MAG: lysylphosphatidylglycerol synthase transmembrane domain-containing protein [Nitrospirota bacterium]